MEQAVPDWKRNPEQKKRLIQHMIELLREGHKMLDESCPRCGAILFFRKDVGLKYCPNCRIFLASPEEIKKIKQSQLDVRIIGSLEGSSIVPYEPNVEITSEGQKVEISEEKRVKSYSRKPKKESDFIGELDNLMPRILKRLLEIADYEIERMTFIELLNALKLLIEIKRLREIE